MSSIYKQRRRLPRYAAWATAAILLGVSIFGGYTSATRTQSPLSSDIRSQLPFSPFIMPKNVKEYTTSDIKFNTVEGGVKILSFLIHTKDGAVITMSEYTQPPEFVEIAEYKERFLTNVAQQYATVQTANGTIYLGRLTKQDNKQLGILSERGILLFMAPDKDLDETTWRRLGDRLEIDKIIE